MKPQIKSVVFCFLKLFCIFAKIFYMSLCKEQIEHLERYLGGKSSSRRWLKKQFSRFMRRKYKKKNMDDESQPKEGYKGWEY